ncbi:MAG: aminodeoxychorismate synthase component I [Phycisphaerae bacterium]|nr:aminodeoxychorismate synthase component I [Phycisphaerae bacterium]
MPDKPGQQSVRWAAREIPAPINIAALRYEIGAIRHGVILESAAAAPRWGRYAIYAVSPVKTDMLLQSDSVDPFERLAERVRALGAVQSPGELPFVGGWIGYLAYEAGHCIEPSAGRRGGVDRLPISYWSLFDTVIIHDGERGTWHVAGIELPPRLFDDAQVERAPLDDRLDELADCVATLDSDYQADCSTDWVEIGGPGWNYSREDYLAKVSRIIEYIRAGDIFQTNLSRRLSLPLKAHPFSIYERLCESNPATHAAYLPIDPAGTHFGPAAVISSSPELFLHLRDGVVTSRPIKGTRPRGATPEEDAAAYRALAESEKDRAELNMIVDLVRNDIGRVCDFGSVRVESAGEIETLPTVFHRTATVIGRLRRDANAVNLLRAAFPGGSVTGAPKTRAMQIIDELEPDVRGAYCGAIGFLGIDGSMHLNLPIRTMTLVDGRLDMHVGSGVVADSTPEEEYRELQAKVAGMARAVGLAPEIEAPSQPSTTNHV